MGGQGYGIGGSDFLQRNLCIAHALMPVFSETEIGETLYVNWRDRGWVYMAKI